MTQNTIEPCESHASLNSPQAAIDPAPTPEDLSTEDTVAPHPASEGEGAVEGENAGEASIERENSPEPQFEEGLNEIPPPGNLPDEGSSEAQTPPGIRIEEGDLVILLTEDMKRITVRAGQGEKGTHFGQVDLNGLVGKEYGHATYTNTGHPIYLLRLTLQDHIMSLKRITQIIYPKDLGVILMKLGIGHGSRVLECGTGSGALTTAMAWMVGPSGRIYTYERDKSFSERARYNLRRAKLIDRVEMKIRNLEEEDFDEKGVDAVFLDVREPPRILEKATASLSPGGMLGILLPTANQVSDAITALENAPYIDLEVMETFIRKYKINAQRFRPEDRMIGHTGYLVFARRIVPVKSFIPAHRPRAVQIARAIWNQQSAPDETQEG